MGSDRIPRPRLIAGRERHRDPETEGSGQLRQRGSTEVLILALLEERDRHGYDIARLIEERSRGAISFHVASLYPTLYRMEEKDLIEGRWVEKAGQRLTPAGRKTLKSQRGIWDGFFEALNRVARIRQPV